jgi:hypothetical protein
MKLKFFVLVFICLASLSAAEKGMASNPVESPSPDAATIKDGYALLNSLLSLFDNLPAENGIATVGNRIDQLSRDSRSALEAKQIDAIFFNRYQRVLRIFKLITMPVIKNATLEPIFTREFTDFVDKVIYERWTWNESDSIAKLASAIEEEFVELQLYLDNRQAREDLKKKLKGRMLPPPPPPPGSKSGRK